MKPAREAPGKSGATEGLAASREIQHPPGGKKRIRRTFSAPGKQPVSK
jgi:hypothetical protein